MLRNVGIRNGSALHTLYCNRIVIQRANAIRALLAGKRIFRLAFVQGFWCLYRSCVKIVSTFWNLFSEMFSKWSYLSQWPLLIPNIDITLLYSIILQELYYVGLDAISVIISRNMTYQHLYNVCQLLQYRFCICWLYISRFALYC